jgi:hypothetical protein
VVAVTDRLGGIVGSSQVSSGDSASGQATFDLSIPAGRLDTALAELSQLAHVRSRQQSTLDVTDSYGALRQRLAQALAQRQSLVRQLARAGSRFRSRAIRQQLRLLQRRIRAQQTELAGLDRSTRFADVGVVVQATSDSHGVAGPWTPGRSLHDALGVLAVTLGVILVALSGLVPVALVAILAIFALRAGRRHARERALEQA